MSVARYLAELAVNTTSAAITPAAGRAAKRLILDTLGTTIAGHGAPGIAPIRDLMTTWGGAPQAHVLLHGDRLPVPSAVLLNGTMAHALDLDDVHLPGVLHIMSSMLPVTFAVGELTGASGAQMIAAMTVGIEVAARIARVHRLHKQHDGFLPSSVDGGFGATACACRLLGLTVEQTVNAMGTFYAHASGNRQALFEMTLAKRIQPAIAGKAAVTAASLAARGFTGPEHCIEGDAGLFRIYGDAATVPPLEAFTEEIGCWEIERVGLKLYPTCGAHHAAIMAAIDIHREHAPDPHAIESVEMYLGEGDMAIVDRPFVPGANPQVAAQFAAPYAVALGLVRGRCGVPELDERQIMADRLTQEVAARTTLVKHWDGPAGTVREYPGYPKGIGRPRFVRVRMKDGTTHVASRNQGDVLHPELFSDDDVTAKFNACCAASGICPPERAAAIVAAVERFESVADAGEFIAGHLGPVRAPVAVA